MAMRSHVRSLSLVSIVAVLCGIRTGGELVAETPSETQQISTPLLNAMGLAGMGRVSDAEGQKIRGKGFLSGGQLAISQILTAERFEYVHASERLSHTISLRKTVDFVLNLQDFSQQLGPDFSNINLSQTNLQVSRVVELTETIDFEVNFTKFVGQNVVFGSPIRIVGGVFP